MLPPYAGIVTRVRRFGCVQIRLRLRGATGCERRAPSSDSGSELGLSGPVALRTEPPQADGTGVMGQADKLAPCHAMTTK